MRSCLALIIWIVGCHPQMLAHDKGEQNINGAPIEWRCQDRCALPGSPWTHQSRADISSSEVRLWRTSYPDGGYVVPRNGNSGRVTVSDITYEFTFDESGLPRPERDDPAVRNVWCFVEVTA